MSSAHIKHDGETVILGINGTEIRLPYQAALDLAAALRDKGKQAEEIANATHGNLILDQAILTRVGFPIGLSSHPKVQDEAIKEAAWGDIRRYLPGGIKSESVVGTPTVKQQQPTPEQQAADRAFWAREKGKQNGNNG